jgi:hypothetical protein
MGKKARGGREGGCAADDDYKPGPHRPPLDADIWTGTICAIMISTIGSIGTVD